jgi:hypothetical protein
LSLKQANYQLKKYAMSMTISPASIVWLTPPFGLNPISEKPENLKRSFGQIPKPGVVSLTLLYNDDKSGHPLESGNPDRKHWIPDQVRNDRMCKVFSETVHRKDDRQHTEVKKLLG